VICSKADIILPALADSSMNDWDMESMTLAGILLHLELLQPPMETGQGNTVNR
jgi:hypothetical protein